MTKEELWIKESIENYIFAYTGKRAKISDADAQHFTASVMSYLNLCMPSPPSNLDEAAEEYGRKEYSHAIHFWDEGLSKNKPEVMKEDFVDSFKAGAEWMARQGVNLKCWIARDECSGDESDLYIGQQKPRRVPGAATGFGMWCDYGEFMALPTDMFPELTYSDEPIEVELIIRKK